MQNNEKIILFDGLCNLCSGSVQFILKKEKQKTLKFASIQSTVGKELLKKYRVKQPKGGTVVYVKNDKAYTQSGGVLRIVANFRGLWPLLQILLVVPPFIRNTVYKWVARNRYKWFGKRTTCMIPSPDLKDRFLDTTVI